MSFGFSPSDVIALVNLATKVYQGWRDACGEYTDITGTLHSLHLVLQRLQRHFGPSEDTSTPASNEFMLCHQSDNHDFAQVVISCRSDLSHLHAIVNKYRSLETSRKRTWDRIRLGTKDLDSTRARITQHMTLLSTFLISVQLDSGTRLESKLAKLPETIVCSLPPVIERAIDTKVSDLASTLTRFTTNASLLTTYSCDEKLVWRQFRRELIQAGIKSNEIKQHSGELRAILEGIVRKAEERSESLEVAGRSTHAMVVEKLELLGWAPPGNGCLEGDEDYGHPDPPESAGLLGDQENCGTHHKKSRGAHRSMPSHSAVGPRRPSPPQPVIQEPSQQWLKSSEYPRTDARRYYATTESSANSYGKSPDLEENRSSTPLSFKQPKAIRHHTKQRSLIQDANTKPEKPSSDASTSTPHQRSRQSSDSDDDGNTGHAQHFRDEPVPDNVRMHGLLRAAEGYMDVMNGSKTSELSAESIRMALSDRARSEKATSANTSLDNGNNVKLEIGDLIWHVPAGSVITCIPGKDGEPPTITCSPGKDSKPHMTVVAGAISAISQQPESSGEEDAVGDGEDGDNHHTPPITPNH